jgi:hypothetical protein
MKAMRAELACRLLSGMALLAAFWQPKVFAQTAPLPATPSSQNEQQIGVTARPIERPFILKVTTREVVIEVVAIDRHNHPVSDLKQSDFQISEVGEHSQKTLRKVSAFHLIDPASPGSRADAPTAGFRVTSTGGCATATTFHYELAYQPGPEGWTSGYHEILVTTSRPHVVLLFRRHYYVGRTEAPVNMPVPPTEAAANLALQEAACHHSPTPSSISLAAELVQSGNSDSLRYSLVVRADSLAFIALSDEARKVQLDYGICTFDATGSPFSFMHTSLERVLEPIEYERALVHGFANLVEFPKSGNPALARFVVRDRATGNLGSIEVATTPDVPNESTHAKWLAETRERRSLLPQDTGSFGSIVPKPDSMCGDVYELSADTAKLPEYWNLDPIGTVLTYALDVENEYLTKGIPGVTSRPEWFGIDYHGEFWLGQPGDYSFELTSDDGANLYIDDVLVIGLDGGHQPWTGKRTVRLGAGLHTIHLPYFQGPLSVTLVLRVKPPGKEYRIFDVRDFSPPVDMNKE